SRSIEDGVSLIKLRNAINLAGAPFSPRIFGELRRCTQDVIHVHWPNPTAAIAYLAAARHKPLVVTWHSDVVRQKRLSQAFAPFLKRFLSLSRAIIVSSPNNVASSKALSAFRERCRVVPYGIETEKPPVKQNEVDAIRARHGDRLILAVGRLVYYKGF